MQQQGLQEFALDRRRNALRVEAKRLPLEPVPTRAHEGREQSAPFRRIPTLATIEPELRVLAQIGDLPHDEPREERTPFAAGGLIADVAGKRPVALVESLRQLEQRLPELVPDFRGAAHMLDVLLRQGSRESVRIGVDPENPFEGRWLAVRRAFGDRAQFGDDAALCDERVVGWKGRQPALGGSGIAEGP